jgi:hypothetical protein
MEKLQANPNDYFPFTVQLSGCSRGSCKRPIAVGNVLLLTPVSALLPTTELGTVEVIYADETSFVFLGLDDHRLAAGGTITFRMHEREYADGSDVYITYTATKAISGIETSTPGFLLTFAAKLTWSPMVAAFRCEHAYVGQEELRRC